jgi:hypothetical protein
MGGCCTANQNQEKELQERDSYVRGRKKSAVCMLQVREGQKEAAPSPFGALRRETSDDRMNITVQY